MNGNIGQVQVRVNSVYKRKGRSGEFYSLQVADDMGDGFVRIPHADDVIVSFSASQEIWDAVKAESSKRGLTFVQKTDKNGEKFWSLKDAKKNKDGKQLLLNIRLSQALNVRPIPTAKRTDRLQNSLSISGTIVKISVRDQRAGNGIALED